jgi:glycosyltransferase involved in cell wall biosynthesis
MNIVLNITAYNEEPMMAKQLDNALELKCHDHIVVLDDGSTDGTWDILQQYVRKHNNIHVFRNEKNSILFGGENRWKTVLRHAEQFEPTWINNRATDILFSYSAKDKFKWKTGANL